MKRYRSLSLLALSFAISTSSLFAVPPIINDFRSPIVSDDIPENNSNNFVFPDAINLTNQATDLDNTVPASQIKWSFYDLSGTYSLNSRASLNLATDDPNNPGDKEITGGTLPDDPDQEDDNLRTMTIRNVALSPLPLPTDGAYPDSEANGGNVGPQFLAAQSKVITLFASDGQSASSKSLFVFTENKGFDRLSGICDFGCPQVVTPGPGNGWTSTAVLSPNGFSMTSGANGVCIQSPLTGAAFGVWSSPFGALTLVQNNVYRIRINVESTAPLAAGTTPLWDFVIDNVKTDAAGNLQLGSQGKYSLDVIIWDTNGNANSVGLASGGRRTFDIWFAPLPVQAVDWNSPSGEFAPPNDAFNDARFQFRVIDVQIPGAFDGENDAGTLCLKTYQVDRIDINDLSIAATVFNQTAPNGELKNAVPGFQNAGSNMSVGVIFAGSTAIGNTDGALTVTPVGTQWGSVEIVDLDVGDDNVAFATGSTLADNWPITWNSNELLRITAGGQAPNATGETNPPDTLRILMDAPTSEIGMDSLLSAGANLLGMPKAASVTTYTAFFYTQNQTVATATGFRALRPRVSLLNVGAILSGGVATNNGGFKLTFLKVDKMIPPDFSSF